MADEKALVQRERDNFVTRYEPRDFNELGRLAQAVVRSGLAPSSVKKPEDALIILMSGAELGLTAMQSLRSIHVIQGRPTLSADLMVALVRRSPLCEYFKLLELNNRRCVYEAKRVDGDPVRYEFTWEDAQRAGLTSRDMWKKYPKNMLRARCASALARAEYPELMVGIYDPDELAPEVVEARKPSPAPSSPQPEASVHAEIIDADFEEAEPAPPPPKEPVDWTQTDQAERWHAASKRLHALISECGLNGAASRGVREALKKAKGVESYKHLAPDYLEETARRLAAQSPHDGEGGEMPPRMAAILKVTGMTIAEATADMAKAPTSSRSLAHQELILLAGEAVSEEDVERFLAAVAHITGAKNFDDVTDKAAARYVEMLGNRSVESVPGKEPGTFEAPRADYILSLIKHHETDLRST